MSRSSSRPSIVRKPIFRDAITPKRSSRAREIQLKAAPVSTYASNSSTSPGCAGFHTRNFTLNVPMPLRHFLHLIEFQFHWRRPSKDRHHHLQCLPVLVDFIHDAGKAGEGSFGNAHGFILLELNLE